MWRELKTIRASSGGSQRQKLRSRPAMRTWLVTATCLLITGPAFAGPTAPYPLEPPDTSSPRATVQGFVKDMEQVHQIFSASRAAYYKEPGLYPSEAIQKQAAQIGVKARRASRHLNLSEVPPTLLSETRIQAVILLKEILDRIEIPQPESIPDADQMEAEKLTRWRIPHTNLAIARVTEGRQAGEYLFTTTTVERLEEFYERVKHLPYKAGSWEGVYELYLAYPDWTTVPLKLVDRLPAWAKRLVWDNTVWQWILLGVVLLATIVLVFLAYFVGRRALGEATLGTYLRRLLLPLIVMGAGLLVAISLDKIGITGEPHRVLVAALTAVFYLTAGLAVMGVGTLIGESIVASPRIGAKGLDAAFIRLTSRLLAFGFAAVVLVWGAQRLGVPVIPLVAGLGVGGLALALAAQPTIENFIAGLTLFADRPVRVGDFCRFGDVLGTIEEIGMRSTRIRTLDNTLVAVPNGELSKAKVENYSQRRKIWYHPRIRLRYETTPDQVRYVLVEVRKMLYSHPKVLPDPARIRFVEFGSYSLDLDVFAYVDVTDFGEFLEIAEDLNLRIMAIVAESGTELAVPAQVEYQVAKGPPDKERMQRTEAQVNKWRDQQALYLPSFPKEKIAELADSLDYPPAGSPDAKSGSRKGSA